MDPLKTVYINGLPPSDNKALERCLKTLGLEQLVRLDAPFTQSGFAQFGSAAKVKAAIETLTEANFEVKISPATQSWIERTAKNATVQTVARVSSASMVSRIKAATSKPPVHHAQSTKNTNSEKKVEPDGTFPVDSTIDNAAQIRQEIADFRRLAWEADNARQMQTKAVIDQIRSNNGSSLDFTSETTETQTKFLDWNEFLEMERQWQLENRSKMYSDLMKGIIPPPREVDPNERQLDQTFNAETIESIDSMESVKPLEQIEPDSSTTQATELEGTANSAKESQSPMLGKLVAEYFGEEDEDVMTFVNDHLSAKRPMTSLVEEFAQIIGDEDAEQFARKVHDL